MKSEEKGITLIALIVMIVVLLILAGITLGSISDHDGTIEQTKTTAQSAQRESIIEKIEADLYNEKVKTGKELTKESLTSIIADNGYGTINEGENSFTSKEGNYIIEFNEIQGWKNGKDYQQVKYIESTGSQWIDTNYALTSNSKVEIKFEITSEESMCIFGSRTSATSENFGIFYDMYYGVVTVDFYDYTKNRLKVEEPKDKLLTVIQSKEKAIVNETSQEITYFDYKTPTSAYIFYIANNQPYAECYAKIKLYSCKIWEEDVIVRDFIPVLDKNSVACLYDKVEGKYYYNQGTDEFKYEK